jgi:hypothetical protein
MHKGNGGKAEPIVSRQICVLSAIVLLIGASLGIGMIILLLPHPKAVAVAIDDDDAVERPTRVWPAPIARSEPAPECVDCNPSHEVERLSDQPSTRSESNSQSD